MFGRRAPVVDTVMLWARATGTQARRWVASNAAIARVGELPGGWVVIETITVDGHLIGTSLTPQAALLSLSRAAPDAHLACDDVLEATRDGAVYQLDEEARPPWMQDDPRPIRALVAVRGTRTEELGMLATGDKQAAVAVLREGWTLVPHENALMVCELFPMDESVPSVGLASVGDELHLVLAADGETVADWEWSVAGSVVGADRLPSGELGALALNLLQPTPPPVAVFLEHGFQVSSLDRLAEALAAQGTAAEVAPALVAALGLPDAVRAHLLGECYLEEDPDAIRVQPEASIAAAVLGTVTGMSRKEALTRTPARRAWGAVAGAVFLAIFLPAFGLVLAGQFSGADPLTIWSWIRLVTGVLMIPIAWVAIRNWWTLRGTGHASPEHALPGGRRTADVAPLRWTNRRGPATMICLVGGLAVAAVAVFAWQDLGPLREHGVATVATVVAIEGDIARIELATPDGQTVTAELGNAEYQVGDPVSVTYDPRDPSHLAKTDEVWDNSLYLVLGGAAAVLFGLAALAWWRVIDFQRVAEWMN